MTADDLSLVRIKGEDYHTEFKRNTKTDFSKELVAFANSSGGSIYFGVEDDGQLYPLTIDNTLRSAIQDRAHNCDPPIAIQIEELEGVIVAHVKEGNNKPYRCKSGFYIRNGASSTKLSTNQIVEFLQHEGRVRFDELIEESLRMEESFSRARFNHYLSLANIPAELDPAHVLINLGVATEQNSVPYWSKAGVPFLAQSPAILFLTPW